MHPRIRSGALALAAALLICSFHPARGADEAPPSGPLERKDLDAQLYKSLRDVINRGADLYNTGDPSACAALFRGGLMMAAPLLEHRPDARRAVEDALADADKQTDPRRRSWVLRRALDDLRGQLAGKEVKPIVTENTKTLWHRLGEEKGVTKVVDDWTDLIAKNEKANLTRDGKIKLDDAKVAAFKKSAVAWVSQQTGGPLKYTGKSMKDVHKGMGITDAEFDAVVADLVEALKANEVKPDDIELVKGAVEKTRKDIVEAKEKPKEEEKKDKKE